MCVIVQKKKTLLIAPISDKDTEMADKYRNNYRKLILLLQAAFKKNRISKT